MEVAVAPGTSLQRKRGRPPRDVQTILDAAVIVFAREGYSAATIEMIASEAAASTATLYKRFTNKHGLFVAVLQQTTAQALEVHLLNRAIRTHPFSGVTGRLEAHAVICANPQVRGVMRAWIGEMRIQSELSDVFAVRSGQELVKGLNNQIQKLQDEGLIELDGDFKMMSALASNVMLGVVERFTMMRGLVMGDAMPPTFSPTVIAEKALHAMIGIWGTPKGRAEFAKIPVTKPVLTGPC